MDVEKLQKINALANELKKHNFAKDNDDAYAQAETIYCGSAKPKLQEEAKPAEVKNDALMEQKFQMLLQMHLRKYEEEITNLKTAVASLNSELMTMKTKMTEVPRVETREKQQELKKEPVESHPKRGNYTSADVDVQKMFYFGNKR